MTNRELQSKLRYWQKVLRLQDWDIDVDFVRSRQMDHPNNTGKVSVDYELKGAAIRLLDVIDMAHNDWIVPQNDSEQTLVHELVEIHFHPFKKRDNSLEQQIQEQTVETIAKALIALDRKYAPAPATKKRSRVSSTQKGRKRKG